MFIKKHFTGIVFLIVGTLCVVFAIVVSVSGPKISRQSFDDNLQNQKLVLTFNSPIVSIADDYTLLPQANIDININDRQVNINFLEPLRYDTRYTLALTVTDNRGKTSIVQPTFATKNPDIYYLERLQNTNDFIRKTNLGDNYEDTVVFEHDSIVMYAVANGSLAAVVEEEDSKTLKLMSKNNVRDVAFPTGLTPFTLDGSHTLNSFLFTLFNESFIREIWLFDVRDNEWLQLTDVNMNPKFGTNAQFAPDGKTIIYLDEKQGLILDDPFDEEPELNLGVFDSLQRFLPNQTALFGIRRNQYVGILAKDASEFIAPDTVQSSPHTLMFNNTTDYALVKQRFDGTANNLIQEIGVFKNNDFSIFSSYVSTDRLITNLSLSPNDQYMLYEEAFQPVIYDSLDVNNKPIGVITRITTSQNGDIVRMLNGFDVVWR